MPHLCGYCGGAVDPIISVFNQLHRSSFNLEFENPFESIRQINGEKISGKQQKTHEEAKKNLCGSKSKILDLPHQNRR